MRLPIILLITLALQAQGQITPVKQGIQFFTGTWSEALQEAQRSGKPIFVDFYTTWCGPCKQMAKNVFTDPVAGEALRNVICLSIDAEKQEQELVNQVEIEAYPTLVVFDSQGKIVARHEGSLDTDGLIQFVNSSINQDAIVAAFQANPTDMKNAKAYLALEATRNPEKMDSLATSILDQLSPHELLNPESWHIFNTYCTNYQSRTFAAIRDYAGWFFNYEPGPDGFQAGYCWFIQTMLKQAAETNDRALLSKAIDDYIKVRNVIGTLEYPTTYYREALELCFDFLAQDSTFYDSLVSFVDRHHSKDWKKLATNSLILSSSKDPSAQKAAMRFAVRAMSLNKNTLTQYALAAAYQAAGNKVSAKTTLTTALQMAKPDELTIDPTGNISLAIDITASSVLSIPTQIK